MITELSRAKANLTEEVAGEKSKNAELEAENKRLREQLAKAKK